MRVSITRGSSHHRRRRWTFSLGPTSDRSEELTMLLDEYAVEEWQNGHWNRPRLTFYKRRKDPGAQMPLELVPELMDEDRALLLAEIGRKVAFCTQGKHGLGRM